MCGTQLEVDSSRTVVFDTSFITHTRVAIRPPSVELTAKARDEDRSLRRGMAGIGSKEGSRDMQAAPNISPSQSPWAGVKG